MEQNYTNAGFFRRLGAFVIDYLTIVVFVYLFFYFLGFSEVISNYYYNTDSNKFKDDYKFWRRVIEYTSFFIWILLSIIMDVKCGGTIGKLILGLRVTYEGDKTVPFTKSIIRNLSKILSLIIIGLGFFWILLSKNKQALHDIFACTLVIKK